MTGDWTALLLAAGGGSRINAVTDAPKVLLPVGGETMLDRHFRLWQAAGIERAVVVVGYKADRILEALNRWRSDFEIDVVTNTDYRSLGNTHSLYIGLKAVQRDLLVFDADLVYDERILVDFIADDNRDQILVGAGSLDDAECAKAMLDAAGAVRMTIDKRHVTAEELVRYRFGGEAVGILKFSRETAKKLEAAARRFLDDETRRGLNWEHLLNVFLADHAVAAHTTAAGRWIEIDTPEDYRRARALFEG